MDQIKSGFIFFQLFICFFYTVAFSQVGIGTVSPGGALDVKSMSQGVLIPRVSLISKDISSPVINPQGGNLEESTIVYNIATSGVIPNNVIPGFYYWDGGEWILLSTLQNSSNGLYWNLSGNNINDLDYIGTNNFKAFNFKSGGTLIGSFHPNGGVRLGFNSSGNNNNSFAIGYEAKSDYSESYSFGSYAWSNNWRALALGSNSKANGAYSVALGNFATTELTASNSVAIGYNANSIGNESFSIGSNSSSAGDNSVALGTNSSTISSNSIALGYNSTVSNTGSTALGYGAVSNGLYSTSIGYNASTSQNYAIILGDSSSLDSRVGIGTSNPEVKMHIVTQTPYSGFQLQDGNEDDGKVLTSDISGRATWKDLNNNQVIGEISKSINSILNFGQINLGVSNFEINVINGNDYIQVMKDGIYRVTYHVNLQKNSIGGLNSGYFYLTNWGAEWPNTRSYYSINQNENISISLTKYIYLNAWQSISLHSSNNNTDTTVLSNGTYISLEFIR